MADTLFIALLAIIFLDARRLPQLARQLGRALLELRRAKSDFVAQLRAIEPAHEVGPFRTSITAPPMNEKNRNG
jgi:Sec-independent protein translocase protein TatA